MRVQLDNTKQNLYICAKRASLKNCSCFETDFWEDSTRYRLTFFLPTYQRNNFYIEDFVYILVICETTSVRSSEGLKCQLKWDKVQWLQTHCGQVLIFLGKSLSKDMLFLCPQWSSGPYISRNFLIWTHFVNASWKNRTYPCTFPLQRKEINVVKVRFTMRYSSRKLSNDKVITTACNFWRQIACSFQVLSGTFF